MSGQCRYQLLDLSKASNEYDYRTQWHLQIGLPLDVMMLCSYVFG